MEWTISRCKETFWIWDTLSVATHALEIYSTESETRDTLCYQQCLQVISLQIIMLFYASLVSDKGFAYAHDGVARVKDQAHELVHASRTLCAHQKIPVTFDVTRVK